jgi:hypothetical protein
MRSSIIHISLFLLPLVSAQTGYSSQSLRVRGQKRNILSIDSYDIFTPLAKAKEGATKSTDKTSTVGDSLSKGTSVPKTNGYESLSLADEDSWSKGTSVPKTNGYESKSTTESGYESSNSKGSTKVTKKGRSEKQSKAPKPPTAITGHAPLGSRLFEAFHLAPGIPTAPTSSPMPSWSYHSKGKGSGSKKLEKSKKSKAPKKFTKGEGSKSSSKSSKGSKGCGKGSKGIGCGSNASNAPSAAPSRTATPTYSALPTTRPNFAPTLAPKGTAAPKGSPPTQAPQTTPAPTLQVSVTTVPLSFYRISYVFFQTQIPQASEVDEIAAVTAGYLEDNFATEFPQILQLQTSWTHDPFILNQPYALKYSTIAIFPGQAAIPDLNTMDLFLAVLFEGENKDNYLAEIASIMGNEFCKYKLSLSCPLFQTPLILFPLS